MWLQVIIRNSVAQGAFQDIERAFDNTSHKVMTSDADLE